MANANIIALSALSYRTLIPSPPPHRSAEPITPSSKIHRKVELNEGVPGVGVGVGVGLGRGVPAPLTMADPFRVPLEAGSVGRDALSRWRVFIGNFVLFDTRRVG